MRKKHPGRIKKLTIKQTEKLYKNLIKIGIEIDFNFKTVFEYENDYRFYREDCYGYDADDFDHRVAIIDKKLISNFTKNKKEKKQ